MKKRLISILICVIMILMAAMPQAIAEDGEKPLITFYGDKPTTVQSTEYTQLSSSTYVSGTSTNYPNNCYLHYDVMIEKSGEYIIEVTGRPSGYTYTTIAAQLDNELLTTVSIYADGAQNKTVASRAVELSEGKHRFSLWVRGNAAAYIENFTIKPYKAKELVTDKTGAYKEAWIPTVIQAEDFDWDSVAIDTANKSKKYREDVALDIYKASDSGYYVSLYDGEIAKYTFNVDVQDAYNFSAKVTGGTGIEVFFDDAPSPLKIYADDKESRSVGVWLTKGVHTLKIKPMTGGADIDYLRFKSGASVYVLPENLGGTEVRPLEMEKKVHPVYKELYVSANGDDKNSGTKESPFKTIQRAKDEVRKMSSSMTGDIIVNVESGYYEITESIKFGVEDSGKNGYDVIYKGMDKENPPMLSGGRPVTGWQKYNDYMWRAPVPENVEHVRNLYVNNYPATRARSKYSYQYESTWDNPQTSEEKDGMYVPYENFPKNLGNHSDIELVWSLEWTSQFTLVDKIEYDHEKKTVLIKMDPYSFNTNSNVSATMPSPGKVFTIENCFELLDEPGEFYYNKQDGYIYYYPYKAEDMTKAETYVGKSQQMIMIEGNTVSDRVENIKFDNFEIRYGAWDRASEYGFFTVQADQVVMSYDSQNRTSEMLPAQITVQRANNIAITNCRLSCLGSNAINVPDAATGIQIEGNLVKDISGSGISVGSWIHGTEGEGREMVKDVVVKNNIVWRPGGEYRDSMGIVVYYASNVDVVHNDVYYTPYTGMSIGWGWGTQDPPGYGYFKVNNNKVDTTMTSLRDGAPVYLLGPMRGTEIGYNFLTNASFSQTIGGVYFDAGTRFVRSHHNLVTESPSWFMWSGWHGIIDNRVDSYYATTDKVSGPGDVKSIDLDFPTLIENDEATWPEEAKEIKANAGVEDEYKHLLEIAELPEWRNDRLATALKKRYAGKKMDGWIEAEDFLPGEGIGWYKHEPLYDQNAYRPEEGVSLYDSLSFNSYVIDTNFDGEWLKYEFDVEEAGEYYFDLSYGHGYGDSPSASQTTIWIDDEVLCENYKLPGDSWSKLRQTQLGKKYLEPGKHTFKLMIQVNGFYVDAWRFHDGSAYEVEEVAGVLGNEPAYDEGKVVYEQ